MFPVIYVLAEQKLFLWCRHLSRKSKSERSCVNVSTFLCQKPLNFKIIHHFSSLVSIDGLCITREEVLRKLQYVFIAQWSLLSKKDQGKFDSLWYDQCSALLMILPRRWRKSSQKEELNESSAFQPGLSQHSLILFSPVWNWHLEKILCNTEWTVQRFQIHSSTEARRGYSLLFFCLCDFYKMIDFCFPK